MNGAAIVVRGDAAHLPLPDNSVDLVVTSPPYFGLRDYRDGDGSLAHQIGSEPTPQEFIDALLTCTAEWMRVIKPSGSIFVNLGDKYNSGGGHGSQGSTSQRQGRKSAEDWVGRPTRTLSEMPQKSLMLLPERYRIGCVDRLDLIARSVIVWDKVNPMPESVTDRVRRSHEDWVHLTLAPRYYSAMDEIREPHQAQSLARATRNRVSPDLSQHGIGDPNTQDPAKSCNPRGKLPGSVWAIATEPFKPPDAMGIKHFASFPVAWPRRIIQGWSPNGICTACDEGRRPKAATVGLDMDRPQARRAQELADEAGLTEDHFAALLSVGVSDMGRGAATQNGTGRNTPEVYALAAEAREVLGGYAREYLLRRPTSFVYGCACPAPDAPTRPAVVLDPFGGTGTTALVASVLGRIGISVDLGHDYSRLARWRVNDPAQQAKAAQRKVKKKTPVKPPLDGQLGFDGV